MEIIDICSKDFDSDATPLKANIEFDGNSRHSSKQSDLAIIPSPDPNDILLGRGRWYAKHLGNMRLQSLILTHLDRYQTAPLRKTKTDITYLILDTIKKDANRFGRFLQYDSALGGWIPVNDCVARLKISQAFRYSIRNPCDTQQSIKKLPVEGNNPKTHSKKKQKESSFKTVTRMKTSKSSTCSKNLITAATDTKTKQCHPTPPRSFATHQFPGPYTGLDSFVDEQSKLPTIYRRTSSQPSHCLKSKLSPLDQCLCPEAKVPPLDQHSKPQSLKSLDSILPTPIWCQSQQSAHGLESMQPPPNRCPDIQPSHRLHQEDKPVVLPPPTDGQNYPQEECLVTDEEIFMALGYGAQPF